MGILRNSIDVIGITPESELPNRVNGQVVDLADIETLFIPEEYSAIEKILQVTIDLEIKSKRNIRAPLGRIIVIDGIKKLKICYKSKGNTDKVNVVNLQLPYNTFVDLPKGKIVVENIKVHIADAYFDLTGSRRIYSHILYVVEVNYKSSSQKIENKEEKDLEINKIMQNKNDFKEIENTFVIDKHNNSNLESTLDKVSEEDDMDSSLISRMGTLDWYRIIRK